VSFRFSEDIGRLMENLVFLNLMKDGEIYYWKDADSELDFVVKSGSKVIELIQVSYNLTEPKTKKRELKGLIKGMEYFKMKTGMIITWDFEESQKINGKTIKYIPLWKWLMK